MTKLQETRPLRHLMIVRLIAAIPLIGIGIQHLIGTAPLQPILEGAGFPAVEPLSWLAPLIEVIAGLAIALGWYARPGSVLAILSMIAALYAHYAHDWGDEPHLILPIAVLFASVQVLIVGAGAFSVDLAQWSQQKRR